MMIIKRKNLDNSTSMSTKRKLSTIRSSLMSRDFFCSYKETDISQRILSKR